METITCKKSELAANTLYSLATCVMSKLGIEKSNKNHPLIRSAIINYATQHGYQGMINKGQAAFTLPADLNEYRSKFITEPKVIPNQVPLLQKSQAFPIQRVLVTRYSQSPKLQEKIHWIGAIQSFYGDSTATQFKQKLFNICEDYKLDANGLMAIFAVETGRTFWTKLPNIVGVARVKALTGELTKQNVGKACDTIIDEAAASLFMSRDEYFTNLLKPDFNIKIKELNKQLKAQEKPPLYPYAFGLMQFTLNGVDAVNKGRTLQSKTKINLKDIYEASLLDQLGYAIDYFIGTTSYKNLALSQMPYDKIYALVLYPAVLSGKEYPTPSGNESVDLDSSGTINFAEVSARASRDYGSEEALIKAV